MASDRTATRSSPQDLDVGHPDDPARDCPFCGRRTDNLLNHLLACVAIPPGDGGDR